MTHIQDILRIFPERNFAANSYLLNFDPTYVLIDPSQAVFENLDAERDIRLLIFCTHGHYDHILNLDKWLNRYEAEVFIHQNDQKMLTDAGESLAVFFGADKIFRAADTLLQDGQICALTERYFLRVLHTPGHTRGSSCLLLSEGQKNEKEGFLGLFTGDTLFRGGIGRSDLPGGDEWQLERSLERLKRDAARWPESMPVYPGHGSATTMQQEMKRNPWLAST